MNKAKTKIFAILAAITVLLSGCNSKTNEQPDVSVSAVPSTSVSVVTPELDKENLSEQSILHFNTTYTNQY